MSDIKHENRDPMRHQEIYDRPIVKERLISEIVRRLEEFSPETGGAFFDSLDGHDLGKILGREVIEVLKIRLGALKRDQFNSDKEFHDAICQTLLDYMKQEVPYEKFEQMQRDVFHSSSDFCPLSEVLSFGSDGEVAHIHLAPARTLGQEGLMKSIKDGLRELAKRMQEDPELANVKEVTGTSWIVAKKPEMLIALGFTIDGPVSEEIRARHFADDNAQISKASMTRENFIKEYGK